MAEGRAPLFIKVHEKDNVAIAVHDVPKGEVFEGIEVLDAIPQAHKMALCDIVADEEVMRYGVVIGYAKETIQKGKWINEHMLTLPTPPDAGELCTGRFTTPSRAVPTRTTFMGYSSPRSDYAGTRNLLAIHTTVQCVTGVLNVAVRKIREEILQFYPYVDDVVPVNHAYGCGVAINAPEAAIPIRALQNLIENPNFGGEVMVVGLGCEKLTVEKLLRPEDNTPENVIVLQDKNGFADMVQSIMDMARVKLERLNKRRREELPLSKFIMGMQCGGSDAFSGITANPALGYAADMLVNAGATVLFSEVTEVRDGVHFLAERTADETTCVKLSKEMLWYDRYLELGQVDRDANPTPGNKKGGLANIVEKAMGSIAKSGNSPIVEVLSPGERPTKAGLIYAATPASDIVCGPMQLASGITLQVFSTGRGTPYGLATAPVLKVSSNSRLADQWQDLIDLDAGKIATGESTIEETGKKLFDLIVMIANGERKSLAEEFGLFNDFCIFNPAPIT